VLTRLRKFACWGLSIFQLNQALPVLHAVHHKAVEMSQLDHTSHILMIETRDTWTNTNIWRMLAIAHTP
jgi:hypothetical protein